MKIIRADHLGMCFGVRDAIALALQKAQEGPLTILGELVHNPSVLAMLDQKGVQIRHRPDQIATPTAMITAHGASQRTLSQVQATGVTLLEATCPLVHHAHRAVAELVQSGHYPVIIGKRDHVEVRGITEDLAEYTVILADSDIDQIPDRPRIGIAAQTTQPIDRVRYLVELVRQRFPRSEVRFADTVCQPTKQRQASAAALARQCDAVVVIGGANSNNTKELVQTCQKHCLNVFHVQTASDLRPDWFVGCETVGITAGTSTPDPVIDGIERWLQNLARSVHPENPSGPHDAATPAEAADCLRR